MYKIVFAKKSLKSLNKIPEKEAKKILRVLFKLKENPFPKGCAKLSGRDYYRIRIGDYRAVYKVIGNELKILIIRIGHRKEVYKYL